MEINQQEGVEETLDLPADAAEGEEDTTDWKAEAKKLQEKAIKQRESTKALKAKIKELTPAEKKAEAAQAQSSELDAGSKALLVAYGIKGKDELALAQSYMQRTGEDIDAVIEDDIFQAKLSKLREAKATAQAVPSATKRSGNGTKDDLDYWGEKYASGTPLNDIPENLQMKVLNARLDREKQTSKFTKNPIIGA